MLQNSFSFVTWHFKNMTFRETTFNRMTFLTSPNLAGIGEQSLQLGRTCLV